MIPTHLFLLSTFTNGPPAKSAADFGAWLGNPTNYDFRFLGKVRAKGKKHGVSRFQVFGGDRPEGIALRNQTTQDFEEAILLSSRRQFPEASELFRKVVTRNPEDHGAAIFVDRCPYFQNREKANWLLK